jgi:hypothetical protein
MWEWYYRGMSKQKIAAYILCGIVGLGAMYLLATSPASPLKQNAFTVPFFGNETCTDEPPIPNLHKSNIAQLKQLGLYQEICGSAVTKTLVTTEDADAETLRKEAATYGMTVRTEKELRTDTSVTWMHVSTDSAAPTATRERKLQAATTEAERQQKQGKQIGFYLQAGGEYAYYGDSEPVFKTYLTRWYDMGIRIAISDQGEYAEVHDHEH